MAGPAVTALRRRKELNARLTTPEHITKNRFSEHKRVEGLHEDQRVPGFMGCDRLFKWNTMFGTVQSGYDPKRQQSFIFANIKTSIYDNAPSLSQRVMSEQQRMGEVKGGSVNRAYSAKRRPGSTVILYKKENKPWSPYSLRPYLMRQNMETLRKTLPFMRVEEEQRELAQYRELARQMYWREYRASAEKRAGIRLRRRELGYEMDALGAVIWRKQALEHKFFRQLNLTFDWQKHDMFAYYRGRMSRVTEEAENLSDDLPPPSEPEKDEE